MEEGYIKKFSKCDLNMRVELSHFVLFVEIRS